MKKIIRNPIVILSFFIMIIMSVPLIFSVIKYSKISNYYSEKVIATNICVELYNQEYIGWLNTTQTKTYYSYIYEYEWNGETHQIKKDEISILGRIINYELIGDKRLLRLNPKNPNEYAFDTFGWVVLCFFIFILSSILPCLVISNVRERKE